MHPVELAILALVEGVALLGTIWAVWILVDKGRQRYRRRVYHAALTIAEHHPEFLANLIRQFPEEYRRPAALEQAHEYAEEVEELDGVIVDAVPVVTDSINTVPVDPYAEVPVTIHTATRTELEDYATGLVAVASGAREQVEKAADAVETAKTQAAIHIALAAEEAEARISSLEEALARKDRLRARYLRRIRRVDEALDGGVEAVFAALHPTLARAA